MNRTTTGPRLPRHPTRQAARHTDNTGTLDPTLAADLLEFSPSELTPMQAAASEDAAIAWYRSGWRWGLLDGVVLGAAATAACMLIGRALS